MITVQKTLPEYLELIPPNPIKVAINKFNKHWAEIAASKENKKRNLLKREDSLPIMGQKKIQNRRMKPFIISSFQTSQLLSVQIKLKNNKKSLVSITTNLLTIYRSNLNVISHSIICVCNVLKLYISLLFYKQIT